MASQGFNNTGFNVHTGLAGNLSLQINTAGVVSRPTNVAFSGALNVEMNVTGDGTVYHPGATTPVTVLYNAGLAFNPGDGAGTGCSFTAPVTGIYLISFVPVWVVTPASGSITSVVQIVTTTYTYTLQNGPTSEQYTNFMGSNNFISMPGSCLAAMSANDTAQFTLQISGSASKNGEIGRGYVSGVLLA